MDRGEKKEDAPGKKGGSLATYLKKTQRGEEGGEEKGF